RDGVGGAGAVYPGAGLLRLAEPVREVAHACDREVLHRTRRRLADHRSDLRRAALADHDAGGPGALGHAADRAEVAGVLDLVERDHEGVVAVEQLPRVGVTVGLDLGAHALVIARAAETREIVVARLGRME